MIRLTGGRDKGRYIKSPDGLKTRPISANLRKVLFDTLGDRIIDARVLDVFAGVGTVGFEALSRGAREVIFIEKEPKMAKIILENARLLGYTDRVRVLVKDAFKVESYLEGTFDIIFLGPPYPLKGIERLPGLFLRFLGSMGVMIIQHHHKSVIEVPDGCVIRVKKLGENVLTFLEVTDEKGDLSRDF